MLVCSYILPVPIVVSKRLLPIVPKLLLLPIVAVCLLLHKSSAAKIFQKK